MCDYKGASKALLHMHRMRLHVDQYLTCNKCGFKANNTIYLKAHQFENHSATRDKHIIAKEYPSLNIVAV